MAPEQPGRGKLAEFMTNHILADEHRDELIPVVHGNRVANEVRRNRRRSRPRLNYLLFVLAVHQLHLLEEFFLDERALL